MRFGWQLLPIPLVVCVLSAASVLAGAPSEPAAPEGNAVETAQEPFARCLPKGIKPTDVVEAALGSATGKPQLVSDMLEQLRATCDGEGKLIDGNGRSIVFYHLIGCWGYPPPGYLELLEKQRLELDELKQHHTVIGMTCNPSGARIP